MKFYVPDNPRFGAPPPLCRSQQPMLAEKAVAKKRRRMIGVCAYFSIPLLCILAQFLVCRWVVNWNVGFVTQCWSEGALAVGIVFSCWCLESWFNRRFFR